MRSRASTWFAAAAAACVLVAVAVLVADDRELAFTLGVPAEAAVVTLERGQQVCQGPIDVPVDAARVRLGLGAPRDPGAPVDLLARPAAGERVLGRARVLGGDGGRVVTRTAIAGVTGGDRIDLCVRNAGATPVVLYGDAGGTLHASTAQVDGRVVAPDVAVEFERAAPASLMSMLSAVFERASLFKAAWVGPWLFWMLSALLALGVPLCLWRALRAGEAGTQRVAGNRPKV